MNKRLKLILTTVLASALIIPSGAFFVLTLTVRYFELEPDGTPFPVTASIFFLIIFILGLWVNTQAKRIRKSSSEV